MNIHPSDIRLSEGSPFVEDAVFDGRGTNFAVYSSAATEVEVCLFNRTGERELARIALPECTNQIWHGHVEQVRPGTIYGLRVHGPYEPRNGLRFNPNKLLMDPCARSHYGSLTGCPEVFGYRLDSPDKDLSFDDRDSASFVPKCVVTDPDVVSPRAQVNVIPWSETNLYETHVRGFSMRHPDLPPALRSIFWRPGQQTGGGLSA